MRKQRLASVSLARAPVPQSLASIDWEKGACRIVINLSPDIFFHSCAFALGLGLNVQEKCYVGMQVVVDVNVFFPGGELNLDS